MPSSSLIGLRTLMCGPDVAAYGVIGGATSSPRDSSESLRLQHRAYDPVVRSPRSCRTWTDDHRSIALLRRAFVRAVAVVVGALPESRSEGPASTTRSRHPDQWTHSRRKVSQDQPVISKCSMRNVCLPASRSISATSSVGPWCVQRSITCLPSTRTRTPSSEVTRSR